MNSKLFREQLLHERRPLPKRARLRADIWLFWISADRKLERNRCVFGSPLTVISSRSRVYWFLRFLSPPARFAFHDNDKTVGRAEQVRAVLVAAACFGDEMKRSLRTSAAHGEGEERGGEKRINAHLFAQQYYAFNYRRKSVHCSPNKRKQ